MDRRVKLIMFFVGMMVFAWSGAEHDLAEGATEQPTPMELAALEKSTGELPWTGHFKIGPHWRLYGRSIYRYNRHKGATGDPSSDRSVNRLYYPIISAENPHWKQLAELTEKYGSASAIPEAEYAALKVQFVMLVKSSQFKTIGEIPMQPVAAESITGLLIGSGISLSDEWEEQFKQQFPWIELDRVRVLEEGRKPVSRSISLGFMIAGMMLLFGGLVWTFGDHFTRPRHERCGLCGRAAPTRWVCFHQNIGAVFRRYSNLVEGDLCKSCIHRHFWKFTTVTLFVGWWTVTSVFITPFTLFSNLGTYLLCLPMRSKLRTPPAPTLDSTPAAMPPAL